MLSVDWETELFVYVFLIQSRPVHMAAHGLHHLTGPQVTNQPTTWTLNY